MLAAVERLASIQVLRAIAALAVVLSHTTGNLLGAFGVDLFFVISGYVITRSAQGKTAGQFLFDRIWRIYPIYWLAVLPWVAVAIYDGTATGSKLASSLTLWPIYGTYFSQSYLTVAWTLSFEMLFYFAFAISIWRDSTAIPVGIFLASMVAMVFVPSALFGFVGNPIICEFLIGVALTFVSLRPKIALALIPVALLLLGLSDADFLGRQEIRPDIDRHFERLFSWGLPAAMLFYAAICHERHFTRWATPLVTLGAASYSIYLFHLIATWSLDTHWLVETAAAVGLGLAMWWAIERRIISMKPASLSPAPAVAR